jgi:transcriptional regulator with XRE-family HTH domain
MSDFAGMAIGSRIKARREKLGLQQKDLAERLECAQSTVSDWEKCDVAELLA